MSGVPPSCPCRSVRDLVSSSRHVARSVRICRTTRSCTASPPRVIGRFAVVRLLRAVNTRLGSRRTSRGPRTATLCSIASTRSRVAGLRGQVVPNLLLHPVSDIREAATGVAEGKGLHPAAQDRIDTRNHLCDRPRPMTPKDRLEGLQQRRPLLAARRPQRRRPRQLRIRRNSKPRYPKLSPCVRS